MNHALLISLGLSSESATIVMDEIAAGAADKRRLDFCNTYIDLEPGFYVLRFRVTESCEIRQAIDATMANTQLPMNALKFYIKERHNPQLGVYFVACGALSVTAAQQAGRPLYGTNIMHAFPDETTYQARITALRKQGARVQ